MDECVSFFSVFPSGPLTTCFFDTLDYSFGGNQGGDTFQEPSVRRLFISVCYLNEIEHVYTTVEEEMPNIRMFFQQGINHVRAYVLEKFPEQYDDLEREEELDVKLERLFCRSAGDWVFCIHCLTRFKVEVYLKKGKYCGFCGGWWHLETLKRSYYFTSGIDSEVDTEESENKDGILQVMKTSLIPYENKVLKLVPLILLPPRLDVDDQICNVCHDPLDENSMLVKGKACPRMNNEHFIHCRCSKRWFRTQIIKNHLRKPTCPAGHNCELPFKRFLNYTDYRSLKHLWGVAASSRQVKLTHGPDKDKDEDEDQEQENEDQEHEQENEDQDDDEDEDDDDDDDDDP